MVSAIFNSIRDAWAVRAMNNSPHVQQLKQQLHELAGGLKNLAKIGGVATAILLTLSACVSPVFLISTVSFGWLTYEIFTVAERIDQLGTDNRLVLRLFRGVNSTDAAKRAFLDYASQGLPVCSFVYHMVN